MTTNAMAGSVGTLAAEGLRAVALDAVARGWCVFPVKPDSLTPAVENWRERATTDAARIHRAWDGEIPPVAWRSPGVVDGADVLAVLTERAEARIPFETLSVVTPGGLQLCFRPAVEFIPDNRSDDRPDTA
ncbi:bifunctional DNA primase/polymerase [Streptomyces goshikiensis]|uniref:bifunctional DNA primase/polymerase n=1 Tax=Streptomyces goshikiensis TaxID=1942 RepID=UPI0036AB707A